MWIFISLLALNLVHASKPNCSLDLILRQAHPNKECVAEYLGKIKNEQDRGEAKFRLMQWKPIKDLKVFSRDGLIEAYRGDDLILRSIMLKKQKPMMIWLDGKILVDHSDNPSFARRLDNAFKKSKNARFQFGFPSAYAQSSSPSAVSADIQKDLILTYALSDGIGWTDPTSMIQSQTEDLRPFLPKGGFLAKMIFGARKIKCATPPTVAPTTFYNSNWNSTELEITPKSETEFIIRGLKNNQTQLIKMGTWPAVGIVLDRKVLSPKGAIETATISVCADPHCDQVKSTDPLSSWNLLLSKNREQTEKLPQKVGALEAESLKNYNLQYQGEIVGKLFGLSVLGQCCANPNCPPEMEKRFAIDLQPTPKEQTATAE